jgi:hypothetical protein
MNTTTKRAGLLAGLAVLAAAGLGCSGDSQGQVPSEGTRLETAADASTSSVGIEVKDDGHTLTIDTEGEDTGGASIEALAAVLYALDTPDAVIARMDSTRALDGRQDASWADLTASWTYHPDDGLDVIIEDGAS